MAHQKDNGDSDPLTNIPAVYEPPGNSDMEILQKYFSQFQSAVKGSSFPWLYFAAAVVLFAVILNPLTAKLVKDRLSPWLFFAIQLVASIGIVAFAFWRE